MAADQGLTRRSRVRRRPEFERAYQDGSRFRGKLLSVFVVRNGGSHARCGVAASRKVGSSVQRNRAKRLAREIFRRHRVAEGVDIIIVPRREILDAPFARVEADYLAALGRLVGRREPPLSGASGDRHRSHTDI